jgi:hypothetical protein
MTMTDVTALARRWRTEVDLAGDGTGWTLCPGVTDFQPKWADAQVQDSTDYESDGWSSSTKTLQGWSVAITLNRKVSADSTAYNEVHEALRAASRAFGSDSYVAVRFADRTGAPEAYSGSALVQWEPSGGDAKALDAVKITLTGDGALAEIDNWLSA